MHALIYAWLASGNTPSLPDNNLKIAIVTAISVVLAAAITGFTTTYHSRNNHPAVDEGAAQTFINDLLTRVDQATQRILTLEIQRDQQAVRVDELERYCWQAGIDPNTGDPVRRRRPDTSGTDERE